MVIEAQSGIERQPVRQALAEIDIAGRNVYVDGKKAEMTPKEYELLFYLTENAGIAVSREKLLTDVWGYDYAGDTNVVDVYIRYLRKKIDDGHERKLIHTVRGMGYVLREETP